MIQPIGTVVALALPQPSLQVFHLVPQLPLSQLAMELFQDHQPSPVVLQVVVHPQPRSHPVVIPSQVTVQTLVVVLFQDMLVKEMTDATPPLVLAPQDLQDIQELQDTQREYFHDSINLFSNTNNFIATVPPQLSQLTTSTAPAVSLVALLSLALLSLPCSCKQRLHLRNSVVISVIKEVNKKWCLLNSAFSHGLGNG